MPGVPEFHTTRTEYSEHHRNVYHDNSACGYGREIKPEHRESGTDGRPRCDRCADLAAQGQ